MKSRGMWRVAWWQVGPQKGQPECAHNYPPRGSYHCVEGPLLSWSWCWWWWGRNKRGGGWRCCFYLWSFQSDPSVGQCNVRQESKHQNTVYCVDFDSKRTFLFSQIHCICLVKLKCYRPRSLTFTWDFLKFMQCTHRHTDTQTHTHTHSFSLEVYVFLFLCLSAFLYPYLRSSLPSQLLFPSNCILCTYVDSD